MHNFIKTSLCATLLTLLALPMAAQEAGKHYWITNKNRASSYITEDVSAQVLKTLDFDENANQTWEFVPTSKTNCYYIKNVATGHYVSGSTSAANDQANIAVSSTPREYYVAKGTGTLAAYVRITSTDCAGYNTTGATTPFGFNQSGGGENVVSWNAGTSNGYSWWTLTEIATEPETPGTEDGKTYLISWHDGATSYITEDGSNDPLIVAGRDRARKQYWEFVPTGKDKCFYIRNKATGHYIASCNMTPSSSSKVRPTTTPVEYYVTYGTGAMASYIRMTSTDCANYATTSTSTYGLNKDGASSDIITWYAGTTNTGSWWRMEETAFDYELRPFTPSTAVGEAKALYAMVSPSSGKALAMTDAGTLIWETRDAGSEAQTWYFVGTNNSDGWQLVCLKGHRPYQGTTRYKAFAAESDADAYCFRPLATADDVATTLTVDGESQILFRLQRSAFARHAQIYDFPCGTYAAPLLQTFNAQGFAHNFLFPQPAISGTKVAQPGNNKAQAYTLFTHDYIEAVCGTSLDISATFATQTAGVEMCLYFDWNRDGIFEDAVPVTYQDKSFSVQVDVPADAVPGWTRMRLRCTSNGLTDAEDEVIGSTYDFKMRIDDRDPVLPTCVCVSVDVNDPMRGTADILNQGVNPIHIQATPANQCTFVCWRYDGHIISTQADYSSNYGSGFHHFTAVFGPSPLVDPEIPTGIETSMTQAASEVIEITAGGRVISASSTQPIVAIHVYSPSGALVAYANGSEVSVPEAGTYIAKVYTATNANSVKLQVK